LSLATLLIILYGVTLVKVIMGSKYKLVVLLISLLMLSSIGGILDSLYSFPTFVNPNEQPATLTTNIMLALGYFILEVDFTVAHWIFAARYRTIANEMPIIV
jgi:hypothetical protein